MSDTVANRVVELEFDNSRFENNVKQSLSTLTELNKGLEMAGAKNGLEDIDKSLKGMSFGGLASSIESIADKFTNLGIIGTTALANITNKAVDAGTALVKSLTLDQLSAGWGKYEDMVTAEQTIISATGQSQEVVSGALDQLLWYTDETSYNFIDMAKSIGKFTSNGVDLFDSVDAMQGIASWAAISGQRTQQASMAMYNLSQALGMGYLGVADWRSIELANMATKEFKEMAIEAGKAAGTLVSYNLGGEHLTIPETSITKLEDWITQLESGKISEEQFENNLKGISVTYETFRNTLSERWFDTNVIKSVLGEYGAFATELYNSISNLGENNITATKLLGFLKKYKEGTLNLTEVTVGAAYSAEALENELIKLSSGELDLSYRAFIAAQEAKTLTDVIDATKDAVSSAWMSIYKTIFGEYEDAKNIWSPIAEEAYTLFAEPIYKIGEFVSALKENGGLDALFGGIANVYTTIKNLIDGIVGGIATLLGLPDATSLANFFGTINKGFYELTERFKLTENFGEGLRELLSPVGNIIENITSLGGNALEMLGQIVGGGLLFAWQGVEKLGVSSINLLGKLNGRLRTLFNVEEAVDGTGETVEGLSKDIDTFTFDGLIMRLKETGSLVGNELIKRFQALKETLRTFDISDMFSGLSDILSNIGRNISGIYNNLRNGATTFLKNGGKAILGVFDDMHELLSNVILPTLPDIVERIISFIPELITGIGEGIAQIRASIEAHRGEIKDAWATLFVSDKDSARKAGADAVTEFISGSNEEATTDTGKAGAGKSILLKALGIGYIGSNLVFDTLGKVNLAKIAAALADGIKGFTNKITGNVEISTFEKVTNTIKALGTGLIMIVAAVWVLSKIPLDELYGAAKVCGLILLAITVFSAALSALQKALFKEGATGFNLTAKRGEGLKASYKNNPLMSMIKSIGVAVLLISAAVALLASTSNPELLWKAVAIVGVIGGGLIAITAVILLLMKALTKKLSGAENDLNSKAFNRMTKAIGGLLISIAITVLIIAAAVSLLVSVLGASDSNLAAFEKIAPMLGTFFLGLGIFIILLDLLWTLGSIFKRKEKAEMPDISGIVDVASFVIFAIGLVVLSVAIAALAVSLAIFVGASVAIYKILKDVPEALYALAGMIIFITAITVAATYSGSYAGASFVPLVIMSAGLIVLAIALAALAVGIVIFVAAAELIAASMTSWKQVGKTLGTLLIMIGIVVAFVVLAGLMGTAFTSQIAIGSALLLAVAVDIIVLAAALIVVAGALAALGIAFSMIKMLGGSNWGVVVTALVGLVVVLGVVIALGYAAAYALPGVGILALLGVAMALAGVGLAIGAIGLVSAGTIMAIGIKLIGKLIADIIKLMGKLVEDITLLDGVTALSAMITFAGAIFAAGAILGAAAVSWIGPILLFKFVASDLTEAIASLILAGENADELEAGADKLIGVLDKLFESLKKYADDDGSFLKLAAAFKLIQGGLGGFGIVGGLLAGENSSADIAELAKQVALYNQNMNNAVGVNQNYAGSMGDMMAMFSMFSNGSMGNYSSLLNGDYSSLLSNMDLEALGIPEQYRDEIEKTFDEATKGMKKTGSAAADLATQENKAASAAANAAGNAQGMANTLSSANNNIASISGQANPAAASMNVLGDSYGYAAQQVGLFNNALVGQNGGNGGSGVKTYDVTTMHGAASAFLEGVVGMWENSTEVPLKLWQTVKDLASSGLDWVGENWFNPENWGKKGKKEAVEEATDAAAETADAFQEAYDAAAGGGAAAPRHENYAPATSQINQARRIGAASGNAYADGFGEASGNANSSAAAVASSGTEGLEESSDETSIIGVYFGEGFVNGILQMLGAAHNAGAGLGAAATAGLRANLDINSPSGITYGFGKFFDLGFVNAVNDGTKNAVTSAANFGKSASNALRDNIGNISGVLAGKYTPRVRPVLDTGAYGSELAYLTSSLNSTKGSISKTADVIRNIGPNGETVLHHEFDDLTIRGVNDKDEFIGVADYSVDEILSRIMRRQYRV